MPFPKSPVYKKFFKKELAKYNKPPLSKMGRDIIDICLRGGNIQEYIEMIPMDYQYAFNKTDNEEMIGDYQAV